MEKRKTGKLKPDLKKVSDMKKQITRLQRFWASRENVTRQTL